METELRRGVVAAAVLALAGVVVGFAGLLTGRAPLAFAGYGVAVVLLVALKLIRRKASPSGRL